MPPNLIISPSKAIIETPIRQVPKLKLGESKLLLKVTWLRTDHICSRWWREDEKRQEKTVWHTRIRTRGGQGRALVSLGVVELGPAPSHQRVGAGLLRRCPRQPRAARSKSWRLRYGTKEVCLDNLGLNTAGRNQKHHRYKASSIPTDSLGLLHLSSV